MNKRPWERTQAEKEQDPAYVRRKRDQAWEFAGCARTDGDHVDETRWMKEASRLTGLLTGVDVTADSEAALARLKAVNPNVTITHFPNGEFYMAFLNYRPITDEHKSVAKACDAAIEKLSVRPN